MASNANSECIVVDNVFMIANNHQDPTDAEWDAILGVWFAGGVARHGLVFAESGAPNSLQRAKLTTKMEGQDVRIAVFTASALARSAGTAVSWFNPGLKIFKPGDLEKAFAHLQIDPLKRPHMTMEFNAMMDRFRVNVKNRVP